MTADKQPTHLAIIPDGNRRWAREHGFLPGKGHREGILRFRELRDAIWRRGIPYFTFWAASEDNLIKRSRAEVRLLILLMRRELERELKLREFEEKEVRLRVVGRWHEILRDRSLKELVDELEEASSRFTKNHLTILFGYDGKREMIEAMKKINADSHTRVDAVTLEQALWTHDLPPVDLVIRTGGEPHWSAGFMMWHTANSQFYFTSAYWPAFDEHTLILALKEYTERDRRFGA